MILDEYLIVHVELLSVPEKLSQFDAGLAVRLENVFSIGHSLPKFRIRRGNIDETFHLSISVGLQTRAIMGLVEIPATSERRLGIVHMAGWVARRIQRRYWQ